MSGLIPRDYQIEAANSAMNENIIVNLPTGSGKTLIAALVHEQMKSRMTLVACASVAVIEQHTQFFQSRGIRNVIIDTAAGLKARIFDYGGVGDENDEEEDPDVNARMLEERRENIRRKVAGVQLVVFDECHHAIGHHPYVKFCELLFQYKEQESFRVLGLTASFIHGQFEQISKKRKRLEDNLRARLWTPTNFLVKNPDKHFYKVEYSAPKNLVLSKRDIENRSFEMMRPILKSLPYGMASIVSKEVSKSAYLCYYILGDAGWSFFLRDGLVPYLEAKLRQKAEYVVRDAVQQHELNRRYALEHDDDKYNSEQKDFPVDQGGGGSLGTNGGPPPNKKQARGPFEDYSDTASLYSSAPSLPTTSDLESQRAEFFAPLQRYLQQAIPIIPQVSPKVESLLEILLSCTSSRTVNTYVTDPVFGGPAYAQQVEEIDTSLVFVERAVLCIPLAKIIEMRTRRVCRPVMGVQSMSAEVRNSTLQAFKEGKVRVIVATSSLEEGIDVADCKVVVRFDYFSSVRSHIQGSGRARHPDAKIFYFEQEPEVEEYKASLMTLAAANRDLEIPDLDAQQRRQIPELQRGTGNNGKEGKEGDEENNQEGDPKSRTDSKRNPGRKCQDPPHLRVREYPTLTLCGVGHCFDKEETTWDHVSNKSQRVAVCTKCKRATVVIKSRVLGQGRKKKERYYCFGGRENDWVCKWATPEELEKAKTMTMEDLLEQGHEVGTHAAKAMQVAKLDAEARRAEAEKRKREAENGEAQEFATPPDQSPRTEDDGGNNVDAADARVKDHLLQASAEDGEGAAQVAEKGDVTSSKKTDAEGTNNNGSTKRQNVSPAKPARGSASVSTNASGQRVYNLLEGPLEGPIVSLRKEKEESTEMEKMLATGGNRPMSYQPVQQSYLGGTVAGGYSNPTGPGGPASGVYPASYGASPNRSGGPGSYGNYPATAPPRPASLGGVGGDSSAPQYSAVPKGGRAPSTTGSTTGGPKGAAAATPTREPPGLAAEQPQSSTSKEGAVVGSEAGELQPSGTTANKAPLPVIDKPNPSLPPIMPPVLAHLKRTSSSAPEEAVAAPVPPPLPAGGPPPPPVARPPPPPPPGLSPDDDPADDDLRALEEFGHEENKKFEQVQ
ncbi:unnamed protein product [Amoebophrya sp. A120]|nr:unnamed protein product [Amoebophrya sp. A120]|eukprot:GSA120T00002423001.1